MSAFRTDGTPGFFQSRTLQSRHQVLENSFTVMHRLTTNTGIPFIPEKLHDTPRKEASDAGVYLHIGHGRETANADNQKETCTKVTEYRQSTHRRACSFYDTVTLQE